MNDDEFEAWAESKFDEFDKWRATHFVHNSTGFWAARQQRSEALWRAMLIEAGMVCQFANSTDYVLQNMEGGKPDTLYVLVQYTGPGGASCMPTEGMCINVNTGEMSYV